MNEDPPPSIKPGLANRRHVYLRERPRGFWYPGAVGLVKGYPKTQEAWNKLSAQCREQVIRLNARGISRKGVPNGWGRLKPEVAIERADALVRAKEIYKTMVEKDMFTVPAIGTVDDQRAEAAMIGVIAQAVDQTNAPALRLKAYEVVLAYTKSKPVINTSIKLNTAEDFLSSLLGEP